MLLASPLERRSRPPGVRDEASEAPRSGASSSAFAGRERSLRLLAAWADFAERDWSDLPGRPGLGCYGTGYAGWGIQTQQKYTAAMAVLACHRGSDRALARALAALRFNLRTHLSGDLRGTDGSQWGHTWISALGIERMMHGVALLRPHLAGDDLASLRAVLCSEADWLLADYTRGGHQGIRGALWNRDGGNDPESNLWNGALLWRTASLYPDHPRAAEWRERAHVFLVNGVSVPADARDGTVVAGKPVRERHRGANFFPHYALDHHGYLNAGYMVICASQAAILHFDLKADGLPGPETLSHHQADLWRVLRQMILADGRLARIGGDTRFRYAYCQEYLLPSLLYAAEALGEAHAGALISAQLGWIEAEAADAGDGGFYSRRLAALRRRNPMYATRLESDRACALGMLAAYEPAAGLSRGEGFEESVRGGWIEEAHGAVLDRCPTRFASFSWRAKGLAQGLCLPPGDGHLAEWEHNLGGRVRFAHHPAPEGEGDAHRRLEECRVASFPGGFVTSGAVMEGVDLQLAESWRGTDSALHRLALAALPDGRTVVGLHFCRAGGRRVYPSEVKGLHLNLPNDLFNERRRVLSTAAGTTVLESPAAGEEALSLRSRWAHVAEGLGAVGLHGAESLAVHRRPEARGGVLGSLHVEEICFPLRIDTHAVEAGETILDAGWAVLSSVTAEETWRFADANGPEAVTSRGAVRVARVAGFDGGVYALAVNFGEREEEAVLPAPGRDLISGLLEPRPVLMPGAARLFRL